MPRSGITGSYGSCMFSFLRRFHAVLQRGCSNSYSQQECRRAPPHPLQQTKPGSVTQPQAVSGDAAAREQEWPTGAECSLSSRYYFRLYDAGVIQKATCSPVFTAALFPIARTWKQPRCLSMDKGMGKEDVVCICGMYMEYCSAINNKEIMPLAAT